MLAANPERGRLTTMIAGTTQPALRSVRFVVDIGACALKSVASTLGFSGVLFAISISITNSNAAPLSRAPSEASNNHAALARRDLSDASRRATHQPVKKIVACCNSAMRPHH